MLDKKSLQDKFEKIMGKHFPEIKGRDMDVIDSHFDLLADVVCLAEKEGMLGTIRVSAADRKLTHTYIPIQWGIGSMVNNFNRMMENHRYTRKDRLNFILRDKGENEYTVPVEGVIATMLWGHSSSIERAYSLLTDILDFQKLADWASKKGGITGLPKDQTRLSIKQKEDILKAKFGNPATDLIKDFDRELRNAIQHFNFSYHSTSEGTWLEYGHKKLELKDMFIKNAYANRCAFAVMLMYFILFLKEEELDQARMSIILNRFR